MEYGYGPFSSVTEQCPIVQTKSGKIRGFTRNKNACFYSIPYGNPCNGAGRFKAPSYVHAWDGILDCTHFIASAMQKRVPRQGEPTAEEKRTSIEVGKILSGGLEFDRNQIPVSENCLYVNIVTPGLDQQKRPIIVYIHGGGYDTLDGCLVAEQCDRLCNEENVVVISIDHRLGLFGYLYLGAFDEAYSQSGIVGQLDQLLALRWIKNNAECFGGDPDRIVVIGESGGAMKISHLLSVPGIEALISGAWLSSGACAAWTMSKEAATATTCEILSRLQIQEENWREILDLPADVIQVAVEWGPLAKSPVSFAPVCCDTISYNSTGEYQTYMCSEKIPVVVGSSEEELAIFDIPSLLTITEETLKQALLSHPMVKGLYPKLNETTVDAVIECFRKHCGNTKHGGQLFHHIVSTGSVLGHGSYCFANAKCRQPASVFYYMNCFDTPLFPSMPVTACAWHTADLPLFFRAVYLPMCEELSQKLGHALAAFARTGCPSTAELLWPQYSADGKETMIFDKECSVQNDPYHTLFETAANMGASIPIEMCPRNIEEML